MKNNLKIIINDIKKSSREAKRIVFVWGIFNIAHPGHLRLLRFAKESGDFLVVGVLNNDQAGTAFLDEKLRLEGIQAISIVDYAFKLSTDPVDFIKQFRPAVVVKGKEHELSSAEEQQIIRGYGGELIFGSGDSIFSSLDLIKKEMTSLDHLTLVHPREFIARHEVSRQALESILTRFKDLKVCVVGDIIVDEYIQCDPLGMSQEDPSIVVTPVVQERFIGAAAIVAAHAKKLGAKEVNFFSVLGDDSGGEFARSKMDEYGVDLFAAIDLSRPTTLKQRYRVTNKTLLRVSHLRQHKINPDIQKSIFNQIVKNIEGCDLLIFSDFNYGLLTKTLVQQITNLCLSNGVMMVADSQSSSQVGNIGRFLNAKLITPTEHEARLALNNFDDGLVVIAEQLRRQSCSENVAITLGAEGLLINASNDGKKYISYNVTDKIPALNLSPKDPAGAGDCLLVSSGMALATGCSIWEALYLGSVAAACQVSRVGNTPLTSADLLHEINHAFRAESDL